MEEFNSFIEKVRNLQNLRKLQKLSNFEEQNRQPNPAYVSYSRITLNRIYNAALLEGISQTHSTPSPGYKNAKSFADFANE
jgi:hypothetical protein